MEIFIKLSSIFGSFQFKLSVAVFLLILIIGYAFIATRGIEKTNKIFGRIDNLRSFNEDDIRENEEISEFDIKQQKYNELVKPYLKKNKDLYDKFINIFGIDLEDIQKKLVSADITNINAEQVSIIQLGSVFLGVFVGLTLLLFMGTTGLMIGLLIVAGGMFLPNQMIKEKYTARKNKILSVLPDTLRLLADATSTGHTISDSIERVSKKYNTVLSTEFKKASKEAQYTQDWILALEHMAERCDVEELYNLVAEIKITQEKGTPITDVLLNYAIKMDRETSIRTAEIARKKNTTLLIPILLFLFAPLMGLILLPALQMVLNCM